MVLPFDASITLIMLRIMACSGTFSSLPILYTCDVACLTITSCICPVILFASFLLFFVFVCFCLPLLFLFFVLFLLHFNTCFRRWCGHWLVKFCRSSEGYWCESPTYAKRHHSVLWVLFCLEMFHGDANEGDSASIWTAWFQINGYSVLEPGRRDGGTWCPWRVSPSLRFVWYWYSVRTVIRRGRPWNGALAARFCNAWDGNP